MTPAEAGQMFGNTIGAYGPSPGGRLRFDSSLGQRVTERSGPQAFYRWMMEILVRSLLGPAEQHMAAIAARGNPRFQAWQVVDYVETPSATDISVLMNVAITFVDGERLPFSLSASRSTRDLDPWRGTNRQVSARLRAAVVFTPRPSPALLQIVAAELSRESGRVSVVNVGAN
jgi:hypothetical protein